MKSEPSALRDFTVDRRVWLLSAVAIVIGACATGLAVVLLRLIALSTNFFYYHRFSVVTISPAGSPLGHWMVIVPIIGGLIVGLMARYGSDKIRGHGIPEAIEAQCNFGQVARWSRHVERPRRVRAHLHQRRAAILVGASHPHLVNPRRQPPYINLALSVEVCRRLNKARPTPA